MSATPKTDIRAFSEKELELFFEQQGEVSYKGRQVYQWLWKKGVHDFQKMTNLSQQLRDLLNSHFVINHIAIDRQQRSKDGTVKNAVKLHDGLVVESVLIPTPTRSTACVSSQVGCSLDCTFCATASLKRMRNLNPDEIYDQVVALNQQSQHYYHRPLSNIVFMGMGEPLMNYKNVLAAIAKITHSSGLGMAPRRITLSTSGMPKMIEKIAQEGVKFKLAVSLHSARQEVREKLMPFAQKFPLDTLRVALQYWYEKTKSHITFEYIVWQGINDTQQDISALVAFCKSLPCKVNLIQYNTVDGTPFVQAHSDAIQAYTTALEQVRIPVTFRHSRGSDIDAACGQLVNKQ